MLIYLLRHGKPQRIDIWIGRLDIPLSDEGRKEVKELMRKFQNKQISKIYSSPLSRAKETAEIIAKGIGTKISIANEFTAMDHGKESLEDVRKRSIKKFKEILKENQDVIIVTHKRVIQEILGWIVGASPEDSLKFAIDPAHYAEIKHENRKFKILKVNE